MERGVEGNVARADEDDPGGDEGRAKGEDGAIVKELKAHNPIDEQNPRGTGYECNMCGAKALCSVLAAFALECANQTTYESDSVGQWYASNGEDFAYRDADVAKQE